jgi:Na+/phosphate symporter|tara:strand:+ start:33 stop:368 length:336 start_codon:yes stop_codon:yes gene_type:complete
MDTTAMLEAYGTLGATGVISLLFGFMITNLIKSQSAQNESLDKISVDIAKAEGTTNNVEGILLKLLDRIQRESEQQNDERNRRHESMMKEIDDLSDKISYLSGRINGGGKH